MPRRAARRPLSFDDVRRLAADLPDVEVGTSYGTPALKVRGRSFCRLWGEREHRRDGVHDSEVLVVLGELPAKEVLLDAHPGVVFTTPHYDGYGAFLVRLADVEADDLADWLEDAYRLKAPATLRRRLDGQR